MLCNLITIYASNKLIKLSCNCQHYPHTDTKWFSALSYHAVLNTITILWEELFISLFKLNMLTAINAGLWQGRELVCHTSSTSISRVYPTSARVVWAVWSPYVLSYSLRPSSTATTYPTDLTLDVPMAARMSAPPHLSAAARWCNDDVMEW